jgi:antitoxin YobK
LSNEQYNQAKALVHEHDDLILFSHGAEDGVISKAETVLGLKFPPLYRQFLRDFGALVFAGIVIEGITGDDFVSSSVPNGVWLTLQERQKVHLAHHLILISFLDDGEYGALDTRFSYNPDQCPVIVCGPGIYELPDEPEKLGDDFGEFFLDQIKSALSRRGRGQ